MTNSAKTGRGLHRISAVFLLAVGLSGAFVPAQSEAREAEARAIENLLIAPCCWRQPVSVHLSPASLQIREEIRKMLDQGMTRQGILDAYVDQYGSRILSAPPARGFNALSYLMPLVGLVLGGLAVGVYFRRHAFRDNAKPSPAPPTAVASRYAALIKDEIQR